MRDREKTIADVAAMLHRWYAPDVLVNWEDVPENGRGVWERDTRLIVNFVETGSVIPPAPATSKEE